MLGHDAVMPVVHAVRTNRINRAVCGVSVASSADARSVVHEPQRAASGRLLDQFSRPRTTLPWKKPYSAATM